MGAIISGVQTLARSTAEGGEWAVKCRSTAAVLHSLTFLFFFFPQSLTCLSLSPCWDVHGGKDALEVTELDGLLGGGGASTGGWSHRSLSCGCREGSDSTSRMRSLTAALIFTDRPYYNVNDVPGVEGAALVEEGAEAAGAAAGVVGV